jgi:thymidine kinase
MWGGKTELLFDSLEDRAIPIFKPQKDVRDGQDVIRTHNGRVRKAIPLEHPLQIPKCVMEMERAISVNTIAIEEAHMFPKDLVNVCMSLVNHLGINVYVVGLMSDYIGQPFFPILRLMAVADTIFMKYAQCCVCGKQAIYNHRTIISSERILPGAEDIYEPRCRACFDPSIHQCPATFYGVQCELKAQHVNDHQVAGVRWQNV